MDIQTHQASAGPTQITISPAPAANGTGSFFSNGETPSFADLVDTVNPLQHIPIVSSIYRAVSGDSTPSPISQLAGGALFGGPLGFIAGLADVIFEQATGHDVGGAVVASLNGQTSASSQEAVALDKQAAQETHLGDFSGDLKRCIRTCSYMEPASVATPTPQVAPQKPVAEIPVSNADPVVPVREVAPGQSSMNDTKSQDIISLFGNSTPAAAANAYKKADMMSYLMNQNLGTNKPAVNSVM